MQKSEGIKLYCCFACRNQIALHDEIISKDFRSTCGRAFLFSNARNVVLGEQVDRPMITGIYSVADAKCSDCGECLGWKYLKAYEATQKYKEDKFVLGKSKIAESNF